MKRAGLVLSLVVALTAHAQQAGDQDGAPAEPLPALVNPCEAEPEAGPDVGAPPAGGERAAEEPAPLSEACAEWLAAQEPAAGEQLPAGAEADPGSQAAGTPDDEDFVPSEEISEDYPVPLPSDI